MVRPFAGTSIRHKVMAGFLVMLCCMVVLGLISTRYLDSVTTAAADIQDNQLPSVQLLGDMAFQTTNLRMLEASFALTADPTAKAQDEAAMAAARDQANRSFRTYAPLAGAGAERQMADDTWRLWHDYLVLHDHFVAIAVTGNGNELAIFYYGEMRAGFDVFLKALVPLIRFNVDEARNAADAGAIVAGSARVWILGLITVMSLLCIGIGYWLIQDVSVPVARLTDAMSRLAQREIGVAIPGITRGDEIGAMAGAVRVFRDGLIEAAHLNAERETARARELHNLQQFADATFEGIVIHRNGTIVYANTAYHKMLGRSDVGALGGRSVLDFVAPTSLDTVRSRLRPRRQISGEIEIVHADGTILPVEVLSRPFDYDGGQVTLSAIRDLSERKQAEAQIRQLAFHDGLTGLPNRYLLNDRLAQALELSARTGRRLAVLCLDLDRFKFVNDVFGQDAGDRLLVEVACRLSATVRAMDTVARIGGDEFVVIQALAEQPRSSAVVARSLIGSLSAPYQIDGQQIEIGVSIGIASYPDDGATAATLLKNSDIAMSRAKTSARGQYQFFAPEMDVRLRERRELEQDLRQAVCRSELELYFQPVYECASRRLEGFEALLRWTHPVRGPVSPVEFIPVAEESGLIVPLGQWVLETACAEAASWPGSWSVAVNLSPVQFRQPDLAEMVAETLTRTDLAPHRLELEVTEGVLISDPDQALATLTRLRAQGIRISLDDFGTGYSSLSYLRNFPFDKLKIDRSFIQDCDTNPDASGIVAAIVTMGRCLHIGVIAEGVENEAQLRLLVGHQCAQAQGYLLGRPQPSGQLAQFMAPDQGGKTTPIVIRSDHASIAI
jgi:diguanylate cyclase (GGDEF)-like protein/PAS domain S-box-containing protein